jgi:hypothetical protein
MNENGGLRQRLLLVAALVVLVVGGSFDLYDDAPSSWLSWHVAYEVALIASGVAVSPRVGVPLTHGTGIPDCRDAE